MGNIAQLDFETRGGEGKLRALLEDFLEYYKGFNPNYQLALAVWFSKFSKSPEQKLLTLYTGPPMNQIASARQSLLWEFNQPPFVRTSYTSVDHFTGELNSNPEHLAQYFERFEVLYFDKRLLNEQIIKAFKVITEPSGLLKGWYVSAHEYEETKAPKVRNFLASRSLTKPEIGLVKIEESQDFEYCRGLLHAEFDQRWLPFAHGGIPTFSFYAEYQDGRPGYFLFQGGSLYQLLRFEVKMAPEYSSRVLEKSRDDRYAEVYLRAVHPPGQSAA